MRQPDLEPFETASADGARLRGIRRPGSGEPIVLVHGVAMDRRIWVDSGFLDALPDADILALDLRGRGASERVGAPERHGIDRHVEDVRAVMDLFGHPGYAVFGVYFGGRTALQVAAADARVTRAYSFCAHAEAVELPDDAVEEEAAAIEAPDGCRYLTDHFRRVGAPDWMVEACTRVDLPELAAVTRGLWHGSARGVERRHSGQDLVLITAEGDAELDVFTVGERRLDARLWLVDSPTRVKAAHRLAEVGARVAAEIAGRAAGTGVR
ncbi:alpha/beta fold hydrolase [Micromonospora rubida]|uniref:alpha/beta fold hydrolase n=1 Tax=Micromonospora rubida TaxID=2697657 RepID=UPI0013779D63|nr:alpha/beta fold hydrolase [Micromonospora rubida]NBE80059.1 alpha/beta fold hydrolase [Micromonospora rubida]